jgi:hypothetical protein
MRVPVVLTASIALLSCFGKYSTALAECLPTAEAVWHAHPGSHATWRLRLPGHEGTKCWYASSSEGKGTHVGSGRDAIPEIGNKAIPIPRPRSQDTLADGERAPLPLAEPASGGARSILMWGTPMRIDATWEEMFAGRERHAE